MFKNKHVLVAMIVAPILAVVAYFATDYIVGEDPTALVAGQSYPLVARSNCRYASGVCTLVNGDLEIKISLAKEVDGGQMLNVYSNQKLEGIRLALTQADQEFPQVQLVQSSSDKNNWHADMNNMPQQVDSLRLAMQSAGAVFYASVGTDFFVHDARYPEPIVN
jgi:hypothetical protein